LHIKGCAFPDCNIGLLGRYQVLNAATALKTAIVLRQYGQFSLSEDHIRTGLAAARWPGRIESSYPAIRMSSSTWRAQPRGDRSSEKGHGGLFPGERAVLICGIPAHQGGRRMLRDLSAMASVILITRPDSNKALSCEELKALFERERVSVSVRSEAAMLRDGTFARPAKLIGRFLWQGRCIWPAPPGHGSIAVSPAKTRR
jgi:dihydrofolate synthase/folylpolyglutamate synthase